MSELTLHTGCQSDTTLIHVDWFDANNVSLNLDIEVRIPEQDKPRTLEIWINGEPVARSYGRGFQRLHADGEVADHGIGNKGLMLLHS